MADQKRHYDLVIIGTGSAASAVAFRCRTVGWQVAVIDARPFGGTCALRGCHPKKMLVSAAEVIDATARMAGKGVRTYNVAIDWPELMRFKRSETGPAPQFFEQNFAGAGMKDSTAARALWGRQWWRWATISWKASTCWSRLVPCRRPCRFPERNI